MVGRNSSVDLCLACSSSLPPRRPASSKADVFTTQCCSKPICPRCISANPRLARYNPCLRCLGGVGVVTARSTPKPGAPVPAKPQNLDGGIHDEDVFTLGDDEDEDEDDVEPELQTGRRTPSTPPPAYTELREATSTLSTPQAHDHVQDTANTEDKGSDEPTVRPTPSEYYIQPKDTLVGIALKFGVDGRALCRLNSLPPSTLRTTPHLLHTRTVLKLPPSTRSSAQASTAPSNAADPEREARRARERAEKRFQTVTKETDWRVAKAYVALAEDADQGPYSKEETSKKVALDTSTEGRATDQYLDDEEWEARERREGRGAYTQVPLCCTVEHTEGEGTCLALEMAVDCFMDRSAL